MSGSNVVPTAGMGVVDIPAVGWLWAIVVAMALMAVYNIFATVRENIRKEKKHKEQPTASLEERVALHDQMLDNDNRRIKRNTEQLEDANKFQGIMCRVMLAQLNHELSGNDVSHLKSARDELTDYLTQR